MLSERWFTAELHLFMAILTILPDFEFIELTESGDYVHVSPDPDGGWTSDPVFLDPAGGQPLRVLHRSPQVFD